MSAYIHQLMRIVSISIDGMSGLPCAVQVLRALAAVPNVKSVYVACGEATIEINEDSDELLLQAIKTSAFRARIKTSPDSRMISQIKKLIGRQPYNEPTKNSIISTWDTTCKA
jgi:copper chaperone CopZ